MVPMLTPRALRAAALLLTCCLSTVARADSFEELRDADKHLNDLYQSLTSSLDAAAKEQLRREQRNWIAERDRECGIPDSRGDRDMWLRSVLKDAQSTSCVLHLTRARSEALSARRPPACGFADVRFPKDFAVFASGNYSGKETAFQIDQSGHQATRIDVRVNEPDKPVALLLGAYEPTVWNISWSAKTHIVAVLVSGYHRQAVAGLDPKVPLLNSSYDNKGACGYFYISEDHLETLNPTARRVFNRDVDLVYVAKEGEALIGDPLKAGERWLTSNKVTPESYYDKTAPLAGPAGLEDAVRRGLLRVATAADAQAWVDAVAAAAPPAEQLPRIAGQQGPARRPLPMIFRAYVVLKPFVYPAGLYGGNLATFFVPKGVPAPTGNPGHSTIYDFNTLSCSGTSCGEHE
jgi:uncharacterized protein YecT (DUF1311 family)